VRIAVSGGRGQLGAAVVQEFAPLHDVVRLGRDELDVTDDRAVAAVMAGLQPDVIVNCAAYNDVDRAEDHPVDALNANAFAVRALARAAIEHNATLVHYGTDFVFDGTASEPYRESDHPSPRSVYAASKLIGEWFAADAPRAYVLRVESLFGRAPGGPPSRGSIATIVNTLLAGGAARVFEDRVVSPTYVVDAARATRRLVESNAKPGLYHCVNSGSGTWLDLARALQDGLCAPGTLVPTRMSDVRTRAVRPRYCALSNAKLQAAGVPMPGWREAIGRFLQEFRSQAAHEIADRQA
jgi:dTDP-4-dehydrorhamnose reductase